MTIKELYEYANVNGFKLSIDGTGNLGFMEKYGELKE